MLSLRFSIFHRLPRHLSCSSLSSATFSPRYFSTIRAMAKEYKLKDASSLSIPPGTKREFEVEGIQNARVLLVNVAGKISALGAKCTHYGAPLAKGVLTASGRLTCPWHGACFNTTTGDVEDAPALDALPVFSVTERDGAVYITGDESAIVASRRNPRTGKTSIVCSRNPGRTHLLACERTVVMDKDD